MRAAIQDRQEALDRLHVDTFPPLAPVPTNGTRAPLAAMTLSDRELIQKAKTAKNGEKFRALWDGDISGYSSASEADLALCSLARFWTQGDAARIDAWYRQSGLFRLKWDEMHGSRTYGAITIDRALEGGGEVYTQPRGAEDMGSDTRAPDDGLPRIQINNRQLRNVAADVRDALVEANNPPQLFERSGAISRVRVDELGRPAIERLGLAGMRHEMTRSADFAKVLKDGREVDMSPPEDVARDLLATPRHPFPLLEAVIETPAMDTDGAILAQPGYNATTRTHYTPAPGFQMSPVPDRPTEEDRTQARSLLLDELLCDFPFDSESSRAGLVALLLTAVIRPAIPGQVPAAMIDKPQAGTGASLLADIVSIVATGRHGAMMTAPTREEEWRKALLALVDQGSTVVTIDNIDYPVKSAALASAITSGVITDRILGLSEMRTVISRAVIILTGNNIRVAGDMIRRCYRIKLDAKQARPWKRTGFKHPDLPKWVAENRGGLVWALLTLAKAWWAAGKPDSGHRLGGFDAWARIVGGVLAHAGIDGFLGNLDAMYDEADDEGPAWEAFVRALGETFGGESFRTGEIVDHLQVGGSETVRDALPDEFELGAPSSSLSRKLGRAPSKRRGVHYGDDGIHIAVAPSDGHNKVSRWIIKSAGFAGDAGFPTTPQREETEITEGTAPQKTPPNRVTPQIHQCVECGGPTGEASTVCMKCQAEDLRRAREAAA